MPDAPTQQRATLPPPPPTSFSTTKTTAAVVALLALTLALFPSLLKPLTTRLSKPPFPLRTMTTFTPSSLKITPRLHSARGHADHGWLYTFHTFSFASYQSRQHTSFGPLRVINEDRVAGGTGFGAHSHAEFLIFSYIVSGTLEHRDSMGNLEYLKRGDVQFTQTGTGIRHSEYNRDDGEEVHFLQIWAMPKTRGLKPKYSTKRFEEKDKENRFVRIMEAEERKEKSPGAIDLAADLSMDAAVLEPGKKAAHEIVKEGERKVYAHVVMRGRTQPKSGGARIKIGEVELAEGDGAYINGVQGPGAIEVESVGKEKAEILLFDMGVEES